MKLAKKITLVVVALALVVCAVSLGTVATDLSGQTVDGILESVQKYIDSEVLSYNDGSDITAIAVNKATASVITDAAESYISVKGQTLTTAKAASATYTYTDEQNGNTLSIFFRYSISATSKALVITAATDAENVEVLSLKAGSAPAVGGSAATFSAKVDTWYDISVAGSIKDGFRVTVAEEGTANTFSGSVDAPATATVITGYTASAAIWKATASFDEITVLSGNHAYTVQDRYNDVINAVLTLDGMYADADEDTRAAIIAAIKQIDANCKLDAPADAETNQDWQNYCTAILTNTAHDSLTSVNDFREDFAAYKLLTAYPDRAAAIASLVKTLEAVDLCNAQLILDGHENGLADMMNSDDYNAYLGERADFGTAKAAFDALKADCESFIALLGGYTAEDFSDSSVAYGEIKALCDALKAKTVDDTFPGIPAAKLVYAAAEHALEVRFVEYVGNILSKLSQKEYYANDGSLIDAFVKTKSPSVTTENRSGNNVIIVNGTSSLTTAKTEAVALTMPVGSTGDLFFSITISGSGKPTLMMNGSTEVLNIVPGTSVSFFGSEITGFVPDTTSAYTFDIVFYAASKKVTLSVNGSLKATASVDNADVDSFTLKIGTWKKLSTVIDEIYIADGTGKIDPKEVCNAVCEEILSYNNYYLGQYADIDGKKKVVDTIDAIAELFDMKAAEPDAASPEHEKWAAAKAVFDMNEARKKQVNAELFRNAFAAFTAGNHAEKKALLESIDSYLAAFGTPDEAILGDAYGATVTAVADFATARAEFVRIDGLCISFVAVFDGLTDEVLETKTYSELLAIRDAADLAFSEEIDDTAAGVLDAKAMYATVGASITSKFNQYVNYIRGTASGYGLETNTFAGNVAILAEIENILADQFTVGDDEALADVKEILEANEGRKISLYIESFLHYLNFYAMYSTYESKEAVLADLAACLDKYDLMDEADILAVLPEFDADDFAAKRVTYGEYVEDLAAAKLQADNFIAAVGEETAETATALTYDEMVTLSEQIAVYADGLDATYPGAGDAKAVYDALNAEIAARYAEYTKVLADFAEGYLTASYTDRLASIAEIAALIEDNFTADCLKADDKTACEGSYALYTERNVTVHLDSFKDGIAAIVAETLTDYTEKVSLRTDLLACVAAIDAADYNELVALRPEYEKAAYENDRDVVFAGFKSALTTVKTDADAFISAFNGQTAKKLGEASYTTLLTIYNNASPLRTKVDETYVDETGAKKMTAAEAIALYDTLLTAIENKYTEYRDAVATVSVYENADVTYTDRVAMVKLVADIIADSFTLRTDDVALQSILDINEERSVTVHTGALYVAVAAWKEETDYIAKVALNADCNTYITAIDAIDEAVLAAHSDATILATAKQDAQDLAEALTNAKKNADALIAALANVSEISAGKLDYLTAKAYVDANREKYDIIDRTYLEGKKSGEAAARIFEAILARIEEISIGSGKFETNIAIMIDIERPFLDRYNAYLEALDYYDSLDAGYGNNAANAVLFNENRHGIEQTVADCKAYITCVERANYATDFNTKREMLALAATYQVKADFPGVANAMVLYSALLGNIDSAEEAVRVFRNAVEVVSNLVAQNGDYHAIREAVNNALKAEVSAKATGISVDEAVLLLSNARVDIEIKVGYSEKYLSAVAKIDTAVSFAERYEAIKAALDAKGNAYASYDGVSEADTALDAAVVKYNEDVKKANDFFNSLGKR